MNHPYSKIRIIIADDHEMVRDGLQVMINKIKELDLVAEAVNGEELVQLTRRHQPDVILTDVKMPKMDGVEATRLIKKEFPHIGILALSSFDEESLVLDMLNAGARGYLLKNAGRQEITEGVKAAYNDQPYYCKEIHDKLSRMLSRGGQLIQKKEPKEQFSERELEVIQLICQGHSSKEIGEALGLKHRTVERYRDNIMEKMDVKNVAGVVMYAVSNGLCKPLT